MALHINKRMQLKWKDKRLWIKMHGTCTAGRKYESFLNVQTVGSNVQNVQESGGYISGSGTGSIAYTNGSSFNFLVAIFKICK
jgi:hypothetical protein